MEANPGDSRRDFMNTGVVLKEIGGVGEGMLKRSIRKLSLSTMYVSFFAAFVCKVKTFAGLVA